MDADSINLEIGTRKNSAGERTMKTHLDCIPCFLSQSLEAARMATNNKSEQEEVLKEVMKYLQNAPLEKSPPELSREVHNIIRRITKSNDPYREAKKESNTMAKKLYPKLKKRIEKTSDSLLTAIKLAIVGNIIDFGTMSRFNMDEMIDKALNKEFDTKAYSEFKDKLVKAKTILYLADNSGEIFFDKLLLKQLNKGDRKIIYVVKANPIINDATIEDIKEAEIDEIAKVVAGDQGQKISAPGLVKEYASKKLNDYFDKADMIISKGQGNYEGLSDSEYEIFFLLVVKCPLVAEDIGSKVGKLILKKHN